MGDYSLSGPHVQLATFCDMVIEDKTGTLTVVRLVDRYTVSGTTPDMQPTPIKTTLAVSLKAGFMRQKAMLKVQPISPSGRELQALELSILFEGDERGLQFVFPIQIVLDEDGLYWFDVKVDEQLLTRIPLRLLYQRVATAKSAAEQPD